MFVILGAGGHVGSATARALLAGGHPVTVVLHDASKGEAWKQRGANVAEVDVHDVDALRQILRRGSRAFLLNPPAAPSTDTDQEERATVQCLLRALDDSGLEKIVAQSTMGARLGDALGDLSVLHEFEQGLKAQPIPCLVIRAAFYMSNWDAALQPARDRGELPTMFPANLELPMVAPDDLGKAAADALTAPTDYVAMHCVEGPARYTANDVADAFASALHRKVEPKMTPRERWEEAYRAQGFSAAAARSYTRMTAVTADSDFPLSPSTIRGTSTLRDYIEEVVARGV